MRKFYIFNINNEFRSLNRTSPYNLFKTFNSIYHLRDEEKTYGINMYEKIVEPINKIELNNYLFNKYKSDDHYTKFMNMHIYNNYYNDEETKLSVNNAYMVLETTSAKPEFLGKLRDNKNLFACDFQNQDYFWVESIA